MTTLDKTEGGFTSSYYWSSTEDTNANLEWLQAFSNGNQYPSDKS